MRVYAERYPDQVAGIVMLDAQPADAFSALPDYPAFYQNYRHVATLSPSLARIGLLGLPSGCPPTSRLRQRPARRETRSSRCLTSSSRRRR